MISLCRAQTYAQKLKPAWLPFGYKGNTFIQSVVVKRSRVIFIACMYDLLYFKMSRRWRWPRNPIASFHYTSVLQFSDQLNVILEREPGVVNSNYWLLMIEVVTYWIEVVSYIPIFIRSLARSQSCLQHIPHTYLWAVYLGRLGQLLPFPPSFILALSDLFFILSFIFLFPLPTYRPYSSSR